ncbi:MAG TPA: DUF364 domain-containing protein [Syntrophales bacterium]|jgi:uncharacterized protein (DUF4213/DUF364 family)|nr:DUF364 domain-containing protein [Syntrophales bacterium]HPX56930.1 DUF364 domain-containing protein [Syntrophales bacterium]HQA82972.1 DUF364 domain-containing protein [Syntrophales bacterium]
MESIGYLPGDILRETAQEICRALGEDLESLSVEKTVIGLFFTGVKLNNGVGGVCFTPIKTIPEAVCCPSSARAMPASGKLKDRKVKQFLDDMFADNPLKRTMGIAVMNALSTVCWQKRPPESYEIKIGVDALDEVTIPEEGFVVVVGALVPAIKALKQRGKPFGILELDPLTLKKDELEFFVPFQQASAAVPKADLVIVTGTTLINDTLEELLRLRKPQARVVVLGPTVSMLPDAFFSRGVDVLGGIMVTDADRLLDLIAEAGSGYHFFGKGAERVVIQAVSS